MSRPSETVRRFLASRTLRICIGGVAWLMLAAVCPAEEDRVTILSASGAGKITVSGTVIDWTGKELRIRSGDGVRDYPAERVVDVQAGKIASHVAGEQALAAGRFEDSERLLKQALQEEPRGWMRREILAAQTRLGLATGDRTAAGNAFLVLIESDPETRHFPLIPLYWPADAKIDYGTAQAASLWMQSASEAARLMGASHLLFHPAYGNEAKQVLDRLAVSRDGRIFPVARAQLWRRSIESGKVSTGEIGFWEERLYDIPMPLRGGPHYLIGVGWMMQRDAERAAAALLWLPIVYDADQPLAASAAVTAAGQLSQIGRTADAVVLYREVISRFGQTSSAATAKAELDRLAAETGAIPAAPPATSADSPGEGS